MYYGMYEVFLFKFSIPTNNWSMIYNAIVTPYASFCHTRMLLCFEEN